MMGQWVKLKVRDAEGKLTDRCTGLTLVEDLLELSCDVPFKPYWDHNCVRFGSRLFPIRANWTNDAVEDDAILMGEEQTIEMLHYIRARFRNTNRLLGGRVDFLTIWNSGDSFRLGDFI